MAAKSPGTERERLEARLREFEGRLEGKRVELAVLEETEVGQVVLDAADPDAKAAEIALRTAKAREEIRVIALAVATINRRIEEARRVEMRQRAAELRTQATAVQAEADTHAARVTELLEAVEELETVPYEPSRTVYERLDFGSRQWERVELHPRDVVARVDVRVALPRTERYRRQVDALLGEALVAEASANGDPLPDRNTWTSPLTGDADYAQLARMTR
jgi:hypothetical protein